ncbi:VCBS repeat-containing protein [Flagellimonas allohymeniacidonis]|uniref:ASPIC/UnbV domain-containing protein n=1 Tax=Flagellimonas allohymeniacidonis TaxID=2517819 RepID=A0A4Q8QFJ1_9FLAO|nr:VCBS repeat-containing protein [Allomuricauda hymeniacidonis]TAI47978.1 hypothetical protein EW142_15110 [Allomuricauda hymeniacidonis]
MNRLFVALFASLLFVGCKKEGELFSTPAPKKTGVNFINTITETDDLNILDYLYFYNGGGVAVGDINNDGLPDIYFSGNQVKNKLFINKGDLQFEDATDSAGVAGNSSWNTGSTMADINGDGWLDIYVCAVVGINGFNGYNELFINNQDGTFTESAASYGLDFDSYSSSATFLDYDLDGDLDLYLLNHAVHTSESFGKASLRLQRNYETGDKLLRNDNGKFVDVSEEAGIFGGINGYGLGVAVSDFNMDGYPDIYVGNDFHEDDYFYLNNGDGTFTESLRTYFGHTSRFSMGSDVADINHDGLPDLISLDMLPAEEIPLKASEGDDNIQTQKLRVQQYGYHYQFTRNMLYVNQPDGKFMETALLSGIAATDWSWAPLFADYDQDGEQDLFVANGIPKRPNDLDFIKFVSSDQIQNKISNTKLVDQQALEMMPSGVHHNYIFKGKKGLAFEDKSESWIVGDAQISGATAYGDLDNDGDLDLVVNNLNAPATIYLNKTNDEANFLKAKIKYRGKNTFGIGTKAYAYTDGQVQFKELFPSRGFQASSEPIVHFGLGKSEKVDSLKVIWPNQTFQVLRNVQANQQLILAPENSKPYIYRKTNNSPLFKKVEGNLGIDYLHKEDNYVDFNREKLIPYKLSDRGPAMAVGDLNQDGKEDILFGGSKFYPARVFVQQDSTFVFQDLEEIKKDSVKEQISAVIADFNGDLKNDIILGAGGGDFYGKSKPLTETFLIQTDSIFTEGTVPEIFQNTSVVKTCDYDGDGDLDIFIGGHAETGSFGKPVPSHLLKNENGSFIIDNTFNAIQGMVTDALWDDFDNDGQKDLIVIGEWMSPVFLKNQNGRFEKVSDLRLNGLWQSIHSFDIDGDGDRDYLLGNWGTNNKFKASQEMPLRMYFYDFDGNGQTETVTAIPKNGKYYPIEGLDGLSGQMEFLRKSFTSYTSFAGKSIEEIFDEATLSKAKVLETTLLASGYLKNEQGSFSFVPFENELQIAPIMDFISYDFDGDGAMEVLVGGNYFGVKPYHGRFDSFPGALINNENDIILGSRLGLDFTQKSLRHLHVLEINNEPYLLAVFNNAEAETYQILNK